MLTEEIMEALWREARLRGMNNVELSRRSGLNKMTIGVWFTSIGKNRQVSTWKWGYAGKAPRLPSVIALAEALDMEIIVRRHTDGGEDVTDPPDEPDGDRGL